MQSYPSPTAISAETGGPFYSSAPSQQHPVSSADELQLSAQISRGLAPIMNAGPGGPAPENQGSRAQGVINHQYEHEQDPRRQAHMQLHDAPMDQMAGQYSAQDGSLAPRKRSKVSRACDECRRKKIRCDATGDIGDEQCSSCKRVGARCQFSRVPMKRGPSKGYIKELADRLNTLEGAIQHGEMSVPNQFIGHPDNPMRRPSDDFSPPPNAEGGQRKRTYSSISGEFGTPYQPQRPVSGWASQPPPDQSRHLQQHSPAYATPQSAPGPHMFREPDYSPNGLPPNPQWRNPPDLQRQGSSFESAVQVEHSQPEPNLDLSDSILDGYYETIHSTYPILSQSPNKLRSRLSNCTPSLRQAFYEALHAAVRSFSSTGQESTAPYNIQGAAQLVTAFQFENDTRTISTNLILLQTKMLLVIEAEAHVNRPGPSRSVLLGSAVGLAYALRLHVHKQSEEAAESDPDSDDKLGRRLWWSLVVMDRWHSSSMSSPVLIPDSSVVLYPTDQALLGEPLFQLARLSIILGHFAEAAMAPTELPPLAIPSLINHTLRGEVERWRESLPPSLFPPSNSPLIHLCYWYIRVLYELRLPESEPQELLLAAGHIVTQLTHNVNLVSPLTYHSTALAAITLIELTNHESTKEEAEKSLQSLLQNRLAHSAWDEAIRELINKKQSSSGALPTMTESQHALTASQGLQRLADLATATEEGRDTTTTENRKEVEQTSSTGPPPALQRYPQLRATIRIGYLSHVIGGDGAQ